MTLQTVGQAPRVQIQLIKERGRKAINWDLSSNKHTFKMIGQLKRASFFFLPLTQTEESLLFFGSSATSNCLEPDVVHPPPRRANQTGGTGYSRCRQIVQTKRNGNIIARGEYNIKHIVNNAIVNQQLPLAQIDAYQSKKHRTSTSPEDHWMIHSSMY